MSAIKYRKTKVDQTGPWDSSKAEAALPAKADAPLFEQAYAYVEDNGPVGERNSYKFLHHFVGDGGKVGAASAQACQEAIAYLDEHGQADGMTDEAMQAIRNHLAAHLKDADLEAPALNGVATEGRHTEVIRIQANAFEDDGAGTLIWPQSQVLMDGDQLRSGYYYDMTTGGVEEFNGTVTMDHEHSILAIVAKTSAFMVGNAVVMNRLQFAVKENPDAQVAYDLYRNGYAKDFSIETYGPWPDENNTFHDWKMSGLSCVVVGNSKSATVKNLIRNSIETARKNGLDTTEVENKLGVHVEHPAPKGGATSTNTHEDDMKYVTIKNGRDFAVPVSYKNAAGEEIKHELAPGASLDVSEDQKQAVESQIAAAKNDAPTLTKQEAESLVKNAIEEANKAHQARIDDLEKKVIDNGAVEPSFRPSKNSTSRKLGHVKNGDDLKGMGWKDRTALQVQGLYASFKNRDQHAQMVVNEINRMNLEALQEAGVVDNSLDLPDLGNFVIPPEMITEIKEQVSNYRPLLDLFSFDETLSLETSMLKGTGEIRMDDVEMNDNGDNTDLKPVKKPTFDTDNVSLKEFAAITPIKASAIRFAAVDIVGHLTKLYRRAYDRALAESVIGRLELAVESNGNVVPYNYSSSAGGNVEALVTLLTAWSDVAEFTPNGVYLMTQKSYLHLLAMSLRSGINGPLANIFTRGPQDVPQFLSRPYAIVPSTLMPHLNTASTKSWTFEGTSVTVNSGVFYADPADFIGKVSGGLNFQVSDVAPYEENSTVKSAFQRDELVFRGYGYRASGLYFDENVAAVTAPGIS